MHITPTVSLARVHDPVMVLVPSIVGGIERNGRLIWHRDSSDAE